MGTEWICRFLCPQSSRRLRTSRMCSMEEVASYAANEDFSFWQQSYDNQSYYQYYPTSWPEMPAAPPSSPDSSSTSSSTSSWPATSESQQYEEFNQITPAEAIGATSSTCQDSKISARNCSRKKPLSASVRLKRRAAANARERKRMNGLNEAFARLRGVLPCLRDRPLSKMEALQMARSYIEELAAVLGQQDHRGQATPNA